MRFTRRTTKDRLTTFQGTRIRSLLLRAHLIGSDRLLGMHVTVVVVLLALIRLDVRGAIRRFLDVAHVAALQHPVLPRAESAGTALVQFRAPLAVEILHFRQTVVTVVYVEASRQRFQVDDCAVHDVLSIEVHAVILVDGFPPDDCEARQTN